MEDFFDDFEDDFDNGDCMDDDPFEDGLDGDAENDDPFDGESGLDDKPDQAESQDDDLTLDPFILGGAMGFAYEEGLRERKRRKRLLKEQSKWRKRKKFSDSD